MLAWRDRHAIGGWPLCGLAIELVVEDGAHRAVGQGADLDCPRGGGFEAIGAERPHQPHDAEAGSEALLRVGPALQDQLAQRGWGWADRSGREASDETAALTHADWLGLLVDRELTHRRDKRLAARLRYARLRQQASVEDVDYRAPRGSTALCSTSSPMASGSTRTTI
jgi:IstB-like ATP binding protein